MLEDDLTSEVLAPEPALPFHRGFRLPVTVLVPHSLSHREGLTISFRKITQLVLQLATQTPLELDNAAEECRGLRRCAGSCPLLKRSRGEADETKLPSTLVEIVERNEDSRTE